MTDQDRVPPPVPASPGETPRSLAHLRALTPARVGLPRAGASLTTQALLAFTWDHACARDAVHAPFDAAGFAASLAQGRAALAVQSQAQDRADYLRRPDLGRRLAPESRRVLAAHAGAACDLVVVIADGLSPAAVNTRAPNLLAALLPRLEGLSLGPIVVAGGARVALGDEIGALLRARMTVVLIGERPGLSAPRSLGAYLTFAPRPGLTDADRNCVSNIQPSGLTLDDGAAKIAWLARAALARGVSGVALKDDSGVQLVAPARPV